MPGATKIGGLALTLVLGGGCGSSEAGNSNSTSEGTGAGSEAGTSESVSSEGVASESVSSEAGEGSESPAFDVMTADGSAMLSVPTGALPLGVEPSDVTLTVVDKEEVFDGGDIDAIRTVIRIEPDGLELLVPATYRFANRTDESSFFLHTSGPAGTIEPLDPMFEPAVDGVVWGSVELNHFSEISEFDPGYITDLDEGAFGNVVTRVPLLDTWVGTKTSTRLWVLVNGRVDLEIRRRDGDEYILKADANDWEIEGWFRDNHGALDPERLSHRPPFHVSDEALTRVEATFTCTAARTAELTYTSEVRISAQLSTVGSPPLDDPLSMRFKETQHPRCLAPQPDLLADLIDSTLSTASFVSDEIDIFALAAGRIEAASAAPTTPGLSNAPRPAFNLDPELVEEMFGTDGLYGCGATNDDFEVVCPAMNEPMPADEDVLVYAVKLAEPFALDDPSRRYQYAVVLDSDDDDANNWQYQGEFVNDFFQGADRWIVAEWTAEGWTLTVSSVDASQAVTIVSSTARAVIFEDSILFYVSAADVSVERPGYRLTAYGDDGNYTPTDRGGDVSGDLPTSLATNYDILNAPR